MLRLIGLGLLVLWLGHPPAVAQGTDFTYQGRLDHAGQPAEGLFDFRFALFDALEGSQPVAGPITHTAVPVSNGLFTVRLDFGAGVFTGQPRWLEIGVRPSDRAAPFTVLRPRQPLTATPYALVAASVSGSVPATQLQGSLGSDQLAGAYVNAVSFVHPSNFFVGLFSGDGSGLTNLNWPIMPAEAAQAQVLWVAPWGDDTRAQRGRLDRPWGSWSNAVACAGNGDVVLVLPGRYTNTHRSDFGLTAEANVLVQRKTNFVIQGLGYPTLYNPYPAVLMAVRDCSNVVVRGLAFESENSNHWPTPPMDGGVFGHLVYLHCAALTIEDCLFSKGVDHGILEPALSTAGFSLQFPSTNQIVIRRNRFSSFGHWTQYKPPGEQYWDGAAIVCGVARVEGNEIMGCARGIEVYGKVDAPAPGVYVLNNRIRNTLDFGIYVVPQNSGATILNNVIEDDAGYTYLGSNQWCLASGIWLCGASDCVVLGNRIEGKPTGIRVAEGGGVPPTRNLVLENTVIRCGNGLEVASEAPTPASRNLVLRNHIRLCGRDGIVLVRAAGTVVSGNQITEPSTNGGRYGIILLEGCTDTVVTDNLIADSSPGRCAAGIAFLDTSAHGAVVAGNRFLNITNPIQGNLAYDDYARTRQGALVVEQMVWATNAVPAPSSGVVVIDFAGPPVQWLTFTNATLSLVTTNRHVSAPRTVQLWLAPAGSVGTRTVKFSPQWRRFSGSVQNSLSQDALGVVRLRLLTSGGDESTVAVWWEHEL